MANPTGTINSDDDRSGRKISNAGDPVSAQDVATKAYVDNAISTLSIVGGTASVTSTELQAVSAQAASAKNVVSARAVSISAEIVSLLASTSAALEAHINVVSAAGVTGGASVTSNEVSILVQAASAAATSANTHANTVSARAVSISAELVSLMTSADVALSSRITSTDTALSSRITSVAGVATSADGHANLVSIRAVSISAELGSLIQIASLAANTVSARAVSISNELGSLLASTSAALTSHINAVSAAGVTGGASMTSNEISIAIAAGSGGGTTSKVSGSNFTTSSTSLVNITGLTFAASASTLYEIDCVLKVQGDNSNALSPALAFSAAGATGSVMVMSGTASTSYSGNLTTLGVAVGSNLAGTANTDFIIFIKAVVTIGVNAGNITAQIKKNTNGTATVYIGSRMTVTAL